MTTISPASMSNQHLLDDTVRAARDERQATATLLALLAEVDERRLYLGEGCSSLFTYCTRVLHLSEHAAYHRIEAARAARRFPVILDYVGAGELTLTSVTLLRPHLTDANHEALLAVAKHKTKREVEHQVACLAPKQDAKTLIRRLPIPGPVARDQQVAKADSQTRDIDVEVENDAAARKRLAPSLPLENDPAAARPGRVVQLETPRTTIAPLARDRFLVRVTLSADAHAKLRCAQDLMRHTIPNGDPATILEKALTLLVDELEKTKVASVATPRASVRRTADTSSSRYIPAAVKRTVWKRDRGQCAFVGRDGRCGETGRLEFHHVVPYARGRPASVANIALRCRAHNTFESEQLFGLWSRSEAKSGLVPSKPRADDSRREGRPG